MKKVALHNLGCKVNSYEMDVMQQMLTENGFLIVPFEQKSDIYIVNTCSVTNIADRKSRQMLHRAKKMNPLAVVVATGCYVQTDREDAADDESIDLMVGNNRKKEIVEIVEKYRKNHNMQKDAAVCNIAAETEYEEYRLEQTGEHTRAYIKIQDGCNQFCSYCIIPYARGRVRSRRQEDVLEEIKGLAAEGYKEVVLTGIHLSSYGLDFHRNEEEQMASYNGAAAQGEYTNRDLIELIKQVHELVGIERIRLGSLEPRIITEEFLREMAALSGFCPHFHLSLQSGSDTVLKRMNRQYSASEYYEKTELIRKYFTHPALTTDVIVGFPGETKEEFEVTRAFLEKVNFYEVHVFKYSRRRGTVADKMSGQLTEREKAERSNLLITDAQKRGRLFREWYIGKQIDVLMEEEQEINGETYLTGYTKEYVKGATFADANMQSEILKGPAKKMLTDELLVFLGNLE